jgi:GNAT superfamily N-acetyltransferase
MRIRLAGASDMARLNAAMRALSEGLGDPHRATDDDLRRAGFGPHPAFYALLAEDGEVLIGAAIVSPVFSTTRGMAGAYVSDLWVAESRRGKRLGARLLAAARDEGRRLWGAGYLRVPVYNDNPRAQAFYARLGFAPSDDETIVVLDGAALAALGTKT